MRLDRVATTVPARVIDVGCSTGGVLRIARNG
jgi:hypothetical protein